MPRDSNRVVYPPEGWTNSLAAEYIGPDQFGNGEVYDAQLDGAPLIRLIYDERDEEITVPVPALRAANPGCRPVHRLPNDRYCEYQRHGFAGPNEHPAHHASLGGPAR